MVPLRHSSTRWSSIFCFACLTATAACKTAAFDPFDPPDAATSPQAHAEPAPLVAVPTVAATTAPQAGGADAGPAPLAFRNDRPADPDVAADPAHETTGKEAAREARESGGYALQAVVRTGDGPAAPRAAEVNASAIDAARRKTEPRLTIDVTPARARFVFGAGFVLPAGAELRSRVDRYGHLLIWPGEAAYRVADAGSLRALLGERRLDVAPLSPAETHASGDGARRLNMATRRIDVATRAAKAVIELATLRESGDGGVLVCRLLLDLMSASPASADCGADEVPLHAEIRWSTRGSLTFDVTSIARRADFPSGTMNAPPASFAFVTDPPPAAPAELLVTRGELAALRTAPQDVATSFSHDAAIRPPETGLLLVNASDELHVAWMDGVPVAWVAPGGRLALPMLLRGRYAFQWRTFLGDSWDAPDVAVAPGVEELGAPAR